MKHASPLDHRVDDILMHTLGLRDDRREPWRNYFVAGPRHHDRPLLLEAEQRGYMVRSGPCAILPASSELWQCTAAGRGRAQTALDERHPVRKLTRSQARYQRYLDGYADYMTFGEYLQGGAR